MENKRYSLSTDELENKIEIDIDGINFEIKNVQSSEYYRNINSDNVDVIDIEIERILGKGSIEKINNARKQKGKDVLDNAIKLNLLFKLIEFYFKSITDNLENTGINIIKNTNDSINNMTNRFKNRQERRNYNKGYNRNNYRRY